MEQPVIIDIEKANIYQKDLMILKDVNFKVHKGDFIYLTGKTGSGKSSLMKTLYAEIPLTEGHGVVAGEDLVKIKRKRIPQLRRQLGIVFQDFKLLSDRNISDNLLFVLNATGWSKIDAKVRILEVLDIVEMKDHAHKMPHQISGGEQQRIAIARALLNNPDVIIADEPTGNLDPETSNRLMKLLHDIAKNGKAVIMATHNYALIEKFEGRVFYCEKQELTEMTFRN